MKHQTNMRGSKHGDPSEFHRLPNLSAIFELTSLPTRPHYGNGLIETYATPTSTNAHCRNYSLRTASLAPIPPRLTVTRGDKAQSPNSRRKVNQIHLGMALTAVPASDRQSPFQIACGLLLPRWQWADGLRVSRSRSLSLLIARIKAAKKASLK